MMAALKGFVDELENELTCSICHDIFTDPKTLQCLHNYCSQCIADWYESCRNRKQEFTCPTCKTEEIDLPDGDASKLRSSFYLGALLQLLHAMRSKSDQQQQELPECVSCEKSLVLVAFCPQCNGIICAECVNAHKTMKHLRDEHHTTMLNEFKQENVDNFIKNQMLCKKKFHEKNKLEYYCKEETCRQCICQKCATLYHRNHDMSSLEEAVEEVTAAMKQDMNRVNQLTKKYEEDLELSKQNMARIQKEIDVAKQQVHNIADAMVKIIRDNEVTMIKTLDKTLLEQQHGNHDEQSDISDGITHLSEFKLHCQTVLDRSVACEILESQDVIKQRCQTLLEMLTVLLSKSIQRNVTFCYSTNQKVIESLQDVGKIVKSVTDPSSCSIESLNVVRCGFVNEFNIITRNAAGELCYTREESIDIRIKDAEGNEVEKKVIHKQSGKYRVSYRAEKAVPYEILVNIGGEPIKNSPQNVNTLDAKTEFKPVKTFGEKGDGKGQLDWPTTISLSNNGEIAIAECNNHRIQIFSLDGKHFREFSEGESGLFKPFGAVFNEDKIIVIDRPDNHGRIQVFDLNGTYVKTIYHRPDEWFRPGAMCTTDDNNIAVSCWGNEELNIKSSVKLLSNQGDFISEYCTSIDRYEQPCYVTYGNGKYFLSYFKKDYIRVFSKNGACLRKFGKQGKKDGEFNGIGGLALFGPDMILVCDVNNHRVQLLTQDGQFIRSFGGSGLAGEMRTPADVIVTAGGKVYVLECRGNRVQVWC